MQVDAELAGDPADGGAGVDGTAAVAGARGGEGGARRRRGRRGLLLGLAALSTESAAFVPAAGVGSEAGGAVAGRPSPSLDGDSVSSLTP